MNLKASPICNSIFDDRALRDVADAIAQAQKMTERLEMVPCSFWEIEERGCQFIDLRLRIKPTDESDATLAPCDLIFTIFSDLDRVHAIPMAASRLFIIDNIIWTAGELLEHGRTGVPGLKATQRWINRKVQETRLI